MNIFSIIFGIIIILWVLGSREEKKTRASHDEHTEETFKPQPKEDYKKIIEIDEKLIIPDKTSSISQKVQDNEQKKSHRSYITSNDRIISYLVLSKSAKYGQYCVAGINLETNELIRLVSTPNGKEINRNYFKYRGKEIEILDVIDVVVEPVPLQIQKENMLLKRIVGHRGAWDIKELTSLWPKIKNGALLSDNYRYTLAEKKNIFNGSLMLIDVKDICIHEEETIEKKTKTRIDFSYNNKRYRGFSVTDPTYFGGTTKLKRAVLLISVSENPYQDRYYKFVAKILPLLEGIEIQKQPADSYQPLRSMFPWGNTDELLNILKKIRLDFAKSKKLPAYCIFYDTTLQDMCNKRPHTKEEMLKVYGIKEIKFEQYGQTFLQAIIDFDSKNSL